jgi:hypothetical protein
MRTKVNLPKVLNLLEVGNVMDLSPPIIKFVGRGHPYKGKMYNYLLSLQTG